MAAQRTFLGYDCIDNEYFASRSRSARGSSCLPARTENIRGPFFLSSSRFIPRKNIRGLLGAYEIYKARVGLSAWQLVILGEGEEKQCIRQMIADRSLDGVHLPGFRSIEELPWFYGNASCFIHPAMQDQWGLVVNEAMASGLVILVSRGTGCACDLVAEGRNGWTFDPTSIRDLADKMEQVHALSDSERSVMGVCSQALVSTVSLDNFAEQLWNAVSAGTCHAAERRPGFGEINHWILKALLL
jgi:glycosyltransferase involved in cell wall biosynthesis